MNKQTRKLQAFRKNFLKMIADGQYPPDRQQLLFQMCKISNLEWNEARRFVKPEAETFLRRYILRLLKKGFITEQERQEVDQLRRRLALETLPDIHPRSIRSAVLKVALSLFIFVGSCIIYSVSLQLITGINPNEFILIASIIAAVLTTFILVRRFSFRPTPVHVNLAPPPNPAPSPVVPPAPNPSILPMPTFQQADQRKDLPLAMNVHEFKRLAYKLSDAAFEAWVKEQLQLIGWHNVELCGGRGDRGVDIRGIHQGRSCIVQCKHYRGRKVTPAEIRAFIGTLHTHRVQHGYFITSGDFTSQCYSESMSSSYHIELWNLDHLAQEIRRAYQTAT